MPNRGDRPPLPQECSRREMWWECAFAYSVLGMIIGAYVAGAVIILLTWIG